MKLPGSTKSKIAKDKNSKNVPHLEIAEIVYWNTVDNDYQHDSRVLYSFVPNKSFGQLLDNSGFPYIKVWFAVQNSKLLQIEHKISITLKI